MRRRALLSTIGAGVAGLAYGRPSARAAETPGVSATAIKIGRGGWANSDRSISGISA
jgi:hypothetical protein